MGSLDSVVFGKKKFSNIKMATIVQRALNNSSSEDTMGITEDEKQQLMEELDKLNTNFEDKKDGK